MHVGSVMDVDGACRKSGVLDKPDDVAAHEVCGTSRSQLSEM